MGELSPRLHTVLARLLPAKRRVSGIHSHEGEPAMTQPYGVWSSPPTGPPTPPTGPPSLTLPPLPPAPPAPPFPPGPASSPAPASRCGWARGAIGGAVAGALVASLIGFALRTDSTTTTPTAAPTAVTASLTSVTNDVQSVVEKAQPSVVAIEFNTTVTQRGRTVQGSGAGSGVII